jgi:hypothetical protein
MAGIKEQGVTGMIKKTKVMQGAASASFNDGR